MTDDRLRYKEMCSYRRNHLRVSLMRLLQRQQM